MPTIHCTQKLLVRLRQPAASVDSPATDDPLGDWCADIEFVHRRPFVVLMNIATGVVLVLPGYAADLRRLHALAAGQLRTLLDASGLGNQAATAQALAAWQNPPALAANRNRSMAASLTRCKQAIWLGLAHFNEEPVTAALKQLSVPFTRKDLGRGHFFALDLLYQKLLPGAKPDRGLIQSLMLP